MRFRGLRWTQVLKWTVYTLLLANLGAYFLEELGWARHTLPAAPGLWDVLEEFPTTLDQGAWMFLVLIFELETYALPDRFFTRKVVRALIALRVPCYLVVGYAAFGYANAAWELHQTTPYPEGTRLCELADGELSFQTGLDYETLTEANCAALDAGGILYRVHDMPVVADAATLAEARRLGVLDVVNALAWFAVLLGLEVAVWLQARQVYRGSALRAANGVQIVGYGVLTLCLLGWLWEGLLFYAWDAFLWLGGFAAIESNLAEWRRSEEGAGEPAP